MIGYSKFEEITQKDYLIVLDANVLLELYRQSAIISKNVIDVLYRIEENLYVPYQAYEEYLKHYQKICGKEKKKYDKVKRELIELKIRMEKQINERVNEYRKHNYAGISELKENLDKKLREIHEIIKQYEKDHEENKKDELEFLKADEVNKFVNCLKEHGRVGSIELLSERIEILQEGQVRYANSIPPGYKDIGKEGIKKYGDLFVWKSILKIAKDRNKNIIFLTNDFKEDWWELDKNGEPLDIHRELEREFKEVNKFLTVNFLSLGEFFSHITEKFQLPNSKSVLQLKAMEDGKLLVEESKEQIISKAKKYTNGIDYKEQLDVDNDIEFESKIDYLVKDVSVQKNENDLRYYIELKVKCEMKPRIVFGDKYDKIIIDITGDVEMAKENINSPGRLIDVTFSLENISKKTETIFSSDGIMYSNNFLGCCSGSSTGFGTGCSGSSTGFGTGCSGSSTGFGTGCSGGIGI